MGAQLLSTPATVLHRSISGDHWVRLQFLAVDHGRLDCLIRNSKRSSSNLPMLDLFDDVQLALESRNEGRTWFIKEAAVLRRRPGLGRSYEGLRHACRFATIIRDNPGPAESRLPVYELLHRSLDAWETGLRPDVVYLKSLYLLARDEGYPVAQEWRTRLSPSARSLALSLLGAPVEGQTSDAEAVAELTQNLEEYLRHHTEIRIGA